VDKTARLALGRIAASQRGLFSAAQASTIGVSNRQLVRAESSGALRRVRRGVYAMAGIDPSPWEQIVAAALAAGPDAVVLTPVPRQCTALSTGLSPQSS
jgi:predicted transcriptional regulator of viral defense system